MEKKEKPLEKMTAKELREMAMGLPGVHGVHAMKKEELIAAIRAAKGITEPEPKKEKRCKERKSCSYRCRIKKEGQRVKNKKRGTVSTKKLEDGRNFEKKNQPSKEEDTKSRLAISEFGLRIAE